MNKNSIVYSFGIGEDISFDLDLINKHNCAVIGFDPTPKSLQWLSKQNLPEQYTYCSYGLSSYTETSKFYLPLQQSHVSGSTVNRPHLNKSKFIDVPMKCFTDICSEHSNTKVDLVKMDIEGSEFEVIESLFNSDVAIDQLLIEFS